MNEAPLVSVLITVYNREKYLAEAIESVLASTFKDFELLIVDDCSTDNSYHIAQSFIGKDARIKVYQNPANLGQFQNRNKAASLAKGTYLKYVDSDDMVKPETLTVMVQSMQGCSGAGIGIVFNDEKIADFSAVPYHCINARLAILWHYSGGGILFPGPTGCIYRRDIFLQQQGFPLDLGINADIYTNIKIAAVSGAVIFKGSLIYWRVHPEQTDALQADHFKMHLERFLINKKILYNNFLPISQIEKLKIRSIIKAIYIRQALKHYAFRGKVNLFFKLIKGAKISFFNILLIFLPVRFFVVLKKKNLSVLK